MNALSPDVRALRPAFDSPSTWETLLCALDYWAHHCPDRQAFAFLGDDGTVTHAYTFATLQSHALAIAAVLQAKTMTGDRVILMYPPGVAFIPAFFGCLYAGTIAVPVNPPTRARHLDRIDSVMADAGAHVVLATQSVRDAVGSTPLPPAWRRCEWLDAEAVPIVWAERWRPHRPRPHDVAFLQYTSGSTGTPRGAMITHRNMMHNQWMFHRAFATDAASVFCGWVPLFHDMGLMIQVVHPVYIGASSLLLSPYDVMARPARWLRALTRHRATHTAAPNFAYDVCVQHVTAEERATIDLSHLRCAINGAEPVRESTMCRFAAAFAPHGLRTSALLPAYGMAEATLMIAAAPHGQPAAYSHFSRRDLDRGRVACPQSTASADTVSLPGYLVSFGDQEVRIVDPVRRVLLADGVIGEVWVRGAHVAKGYWKKQRASQDLLRARCVGIDAERRYLRTGDLGFFYQGRLFLTGRAKDVMIIRGRNIYPEDLEHAIRQTGSRWLQGLNAAFTQDAHGEACVVVVQELPGDATLTNEALQACSADLAAEVNATFDIALHTVLFLPPRTIPRTSSGKVRRQHTKWLYATGALPVLHTWHGCVQCASRC
ncbi:MAG: fatty acyl-AMP ligase [Deltaproteobacteria bacterium]|nr:fatty acyl-AMP ligase [Deltaproteobacteria bacterium]